MAKFSDRILVHIQNLSEQLDSVNDEVDKIILQMKEKAGYMSRYPKILEEGLLEDLEKIRVELEPSSSFNDEVDKLVIFIKEEKRLLEQATLDSTAGKFWANDDIRAQEWQYAKSKLIVDGQMQENGTKLARTSQENKEHITHSFIVLEGEMIALSPKYQSFASQGLQGTVKLGQNEEGEVCVVKITKENDIRNMERLEQEANITKKVYPQAKIGKRKNDKDEHKYYIKMPYLGVTLQKFMQQNYQAMPVLERLNLTLSLLEAVKKFQHPNKFSYLLHGDVKGDNLVVDDKGDIYIIDMGSSKEFSEKTAEISREQAVEVDYFMKYVTQFIFYNKGGSKEVDDIKREIEALKSQIHPSNPKSISLDAIIESVDNMANVEKARLDKQEIFSKYKTVLEEVKANQKLDGAEASDNSNKP